MGFLKRLFQRTGKPATARGAEQAVLVYLDGSSLPDDVYANCDVATLEDHIRAALAGTGLGEYDGNEFGPGETTLYLYGPDAERLLTLIQPVLTGYPLGRNARVVIRKGGPGAPQRELRLPAA